MGLQIYCAPRAELLRWASYVVPVVAFVLAAGEWAGHDWISLEQLRWVLLAMALLLFGHTLAIDRVAKVVSLPLALVQPCWGFVLFALAHRLYDATGGSKPTSAVGCSSTAGVACPALAAYLGYHSLLVLMLLWPIVFSAAIVAPLNLAVDKPDDSGARALRNSGTRSGPWVKHLV